MVINNGQADPVTQIMEMTDGLGADTALEAVGVPQTFELATELIRPGAIAPTSACTANRPRSTSRSCGSAMSP